MISIRRIKTDSERDRGRELSRERTCLCIQPVDYSAGSDSRELPRIFLQTTMLALRTIASVNSRAGYELTWIPGRVFKLSPVEKCSHSRAGSARVCMRLGLRQRDATHLSLAIFIALRTACGRLPYKYVKRDDGDCVSVSLGDTWNCGGDG